jgi:DNA repair protein RadC
VNRRDPTAVDRVKASGVSSASLVDLLALGFSRNEQDAVLAEVQARDILNRFGSLRSLGDASSFDVLSRTGLEGHDLLRTQALIELGRRIGMAGKGPPRHIDDPDDVVEVIQEQISRFRDEKREHFFAILLDTKGAVMRVANIHIGTLNASIVGAREIFREAIRDGASSVIVGHNHPSGDPTPSDEDIAVTTQLVKLGEMLDIRVEDHVIVGESTYTSLRRERLM